MYQLSYDEIMADASGEARSREYTALDRVIGLLRKAEKQDRQSPEAIEALDVLQRLWSFLITDLSDPDNALAEGLKKDLISIGIWNISEAGRLLAEPVRSFAAIIQVNENIRDGLK
jgi:flagellar protein FlaF